MQAKGVSRMYVFPLTAPPTHHKDLLLLKRKHCSLLLWINYLVWHCLMKKTNWGSPVGVLLHEPWNTLWSSCRLKKWSSEHWNTFTSLPLTFFCFNCITPRNVNDKNDNLEKKRFVFEYTKHVCSSVNWIYLGYVSPPLTCSYLSLYTLCRNRQEVTRVGCRDLKSHEQKNKKKHMYILDDFEDHQFWKVKPVGLWIQL